MESRWARPPSSSSHLLEPPTNCRHLSVEVQEPEKPLEMISRCSSPSSTDSLEIKELCCRPSSMLPSRLSLRLTPWPSTNFGEPQMLKKTTRRLVETLLKNPKSPSSEKPRISIFSDDAVAATVIRSNPTNPDEHQRPRRSTCETIVDEIYPWYLALASSRIYAISIHYSRRRLEPLSSIAQDQGAESTQIQLRRTTTLNADEEPSSSVTFSTSYSLSLHTESTSTATTIRKGSRPSLEGLLRRLFSPERPPSTWG